MTNMDGIGKRGEQQELTRNLPVLQKQIAIFGTLQMMYSGSPVTEMKPRNPPKTLRVKRLVPAILHQSKMQPPSFSSSFSYVTSSDYSKGIPSSPSSVPFR